MLMQVLDRAPHRDEVSFALARPDPGESCAYNFVSVPLHLDDLSDADGLATDIGGVYKDKVELAYQVPALQYGGDAASAAYWPYPVLGPFGDTNPLPSGMPSPEFGAGPAGPFPPAPPPFGPLGESNPLPSGMPSPEFGAGPRCAKG